MADELATRGRPVRIMDGWARDKLVEWATGVGGSDELKAALCSDIADLADDLAGPRPTASERLLAESAALDWFALRLHQSRLASGATSERGMTSAQHEAHQKRIDRAHRRYMASLKTLAMVRKLALPTIHLRVADPPGGQEKAVGSKGNPLAIGPG